MPFNACEDPSVLKIILYSQTILGILRIFIPIILIILVSVQLAKYVFGDEKQQDNVKKSILQKAVAAIIVFFVPTILDLALITVGNMSPAVETCYENANTSTIAYLEAQQIREKERNERIIDDPEPEKPGGLTYIAKKDDTIESVASKFGVSTSDLIRANDLKSDKLIEGQTIVIPSDKVTYKVKKGDTIQTVASSYNMTVSELKELNNLKSDKLSEGQVLTIYQKKKSDPDPSKPGPVFSTVDVVELKRQKAGKLAKSACNQIKGRTEEMTVRQVAKFNPRDAVTIFVNSSNCEFITVKNDSFNAASHWDWVTGNKESAERFYKWLGSEWKWSISSGLKLGGIVYFKGHWIATATNGCPHGSGKSDSGLVGLDYAGQVACSKKGCGDGCGKPTQGGQLCMHFRGSILNFNHSTDKAMQKAIDKVLKDSKKYK